MMLNLSTHSKTIKKRFGKQKINQRVDKKQFNADDVDAILDKVSRHGVSSLTDRDRQILEKTSARMQNKRNKR